MKERYPPGAIQSLEEFYSLLKTIIPGTNLKLWATGSYNDKNEYPLNAVYLTSETTINGISEERTAAPVFWDNRSEAGWLDLHRRITVHTDVPLYIFTNYWLAYANKIQEDAKKIKKDGAV